MKPWKEAYQDKCKEQFDQGHPWDFKPDNQCKKEQIYSELLKLAARMLMRHNMPSTIYEDWDLPQSTSHKTWFKILDVANKADEQALAWGIRVAEIADKVRDME